jgi:hypothetical protein
MERSSHEDRPEGTSDDICKHPTSGARFRVVIEKAQPLQDNLGACKIRNKVVQLDHPAPCQIVSSSRQTQRMSSSGTPSSMPQHSKPPDPQLAQDPSTGCAISVRKNSDDFGKRQLERHSHAFSLEANSDVIWKHPTSGACLRVGNQQAAFSQDHLRACKIRHIVVCLEDPVQVFPDVSYFHFPISHWAVAPGAKTERSVAKFAAPVLGWVSENLEQGNSVLIHCLFGAHRAGTTGIACIMHLANVDAATATCEAKSRRKEINPYVFDFQEFLSRFQNARRQDLLSDAINQAATDGYVNSMAKLRGPII